jgi:RHS repeat-associated protein
VTKTVGAATTRHVYDVAAGRPLLLDDGTRKYVWGAHGLAYIVRGPSGAETVEVYHRDHLGSSRALSGGDGSLTTVYLTDEYGVPTQREGPDGTEVTASGQPVWFTDEVQEFDAATNAVYLRARYYHPETGRFLTRDPWRARRGNRRR